MSLLEERGVARLACLVILLLGVILRIADLPRLDEFRDVDEAGYLKGSLQLVEGLTPGYKFAPAGPNIWLGWAVTMGKAAWLTVRPTGTIAAAPILVRPFLAFDRALFEQYHDLNPLRRLWIISQLALTAAAIVAAFRWGQIKGGVCGGLLCGGFFALTPLFIEFTVMARPYATAWAFGFLALWAAAVLSPQRRTRWAGLLFGLAVASRVEMLLLIPLLAWTIWDRGESFRSVCRSVTVAGLWTIVTALLAAPWLLTNLFGNLRTISTVRFGVNPTGETTLPGVLWNFSWHEGMLGILLLLVVGLIAIPIRGDWSKKQRAFYLLLAVYISALVLTMAKGTVYYHQQGPILLAMMAFAPIAFDTATRHLSSRWRGIVLFALLVLPLSQSTYRVFKTRQAFVPDRSVEWVVAHVPPGTRIYQTFEFHSLLPTVEASKALWDEVTNDAAWRKKFSSGLNRFDVKADALPRAMADEGLVTERGNRRGYFILGGQSTWPEPRYDVRLYQSSPVFGVVNMAAEWSHASGVLVWHGSPEPEKFGEPVAQWVNAAGEGTFIYCTPDVRPTLLDVPNGNAAATQPTTLP